MITLTCLRHIPFLLIGPLGALWTQPYNTYLFAPGLWSSEHQVGKYCQSYHASTGQHIQAQHPYELVNGRYTISCNFPEILLHSEPQLYFPLPYLQELLLKLSGYIIKKSNEGHKITLVDKQGQTHDLQRYLLALHKLNFGQELDIACLSKSYDSCLKNSSLPPNIIGFGASRGAAALFNFMAMEYSKKPEQRIKALVFESCFDNVPNLTSLSPLLGSLLPHYNHKGPFPLQPEILQAFVAVCTRYNIPVLFVSSLADQRVPYSNTARLYHALKEAGLQNCYFVTLEHSTHSAYLKDNEADALRYQAAVHAFYKKHGLSYRPEVVA